jgi:hypothetical protein
MCDRSSRHTKTTAARPTRKRLQLHNYHICCSRHTQNVGQGRPQRRSICVKPRFLILAMTSIGVAVIVIAQLTPLGAAGRWAHCSCTFCD